MFFMFIALTAILMISYAIIPVIAASAAPTSGAHKYKGIRKKTAFPRTPNICGRTFVFALRVAIWVYDGIHHDMP